MANCMHSVSFCRAVLLNFMKACAQQAKFSNKISLFANNVWRVFRSNEVWDAIYWLSVDITEIMCNAYLSGELCFPKCESIIQLQSYTLKSRDNLCKHSSKKDEACIFQDLTFLWIKARKCILQKLQLITQANKITTVYSRITK